MCINCGRRCAYVLCLCFSPAAFRPPPPTAAVRLPPSACRRLPAACRLPALHSKPISSYQASYVSLYAAGSGTVQQIMRYCCVCAHACMLRVLPCCRAAVRSVLVLYLLPCCRAAVLPCSVLLCSAVRSYIGLP